VGGELKSFVHSLTVLVALGRRLEGAVLQALSQVILDLVREVPVVGAAL